LLFVYTYTGLFFALLLHCRSVFGANNTDKHPTLQLSTDSAFNFQFLIALGDAITGRADIAPVLGVAQNIKPGDMTSYSEQFYKLANDTKAQAESPEDVSEPIDVKDTWFCGPVLSSSGLVSPRQLERPAHIQPVGRTKCSI
jgi:hypothetical protein